jgi:hypothetical protein
MPDGAIEILCDLTCSVENNGLPTQEPSYGWSQRRGHSLPRFGVAPARRRQRRTRYQRDPAGNIWWVSQRMTAEPYF